MQHIHNFQTDLHCQMAPAASIAGILLPAFLRAGLQQACILLQSSYLTNLFN